MELVPGQLFRLLKNEKIVEGFYLRIIDKDTIVRYWNTNHEDFKHHLLGSSDVVIGTIEEFIGWQELGNKFIAI